MHLTDEELDKMTFFATQGAYTPEDFNKLLQAYREAKRKIERLEEIAKCGCKNIEIGCPSCVHPCLT